MGWIRQFSGEAEVSPQTRSVEDAPAAMRQELIDVFFSIAEHHPEDIQPEHVYRVTGQSLGIQTSAVPYNGFRYATGRDIRNVEWQRIYDLIARLYPDFDRQGFGSEYRKGVNKILAAYSSAWELDEEGRVVRVLPVTARKELAVAFDELRAEQFSPALALFIAGRDAYDDRPRRDRDACSNMFDAMESVAKEKFQMPNSTFGQVVSQIAAPASINPQVKGTLLALNDLRNKNFGHGMTTPFSLSGAEVDFAYLSCVSGILLFTRMP